MRWKWSWWYLLVLVALAWRAIYAYWTPLVNRYVVPPGDDPAFHVARVADFLSGTWLLFTDKGYPLGFHLLVATIARIADWDPLTAVRLVGPALLVVPIPVLYFVGKRLFTSPAACAFAALVWSFLALAPVRAYGDGNYPNMLAGSVLIPLALLVFLHLVQAPTKKGALLALGSLAAIAFVHHLSLIIALVAGLPLSLWGMITLFKNPHGRRERFRFLMVGGGALVLLGVLLWPFYGPALILPNFDTLRSSGTLEGTFGVQTAALSWGELLELHNPLLVMLGLAGLLLVVLAPVDRSLKILLAGWTLLLWLLSTTTIFGLPERFARELAIPLALAAGYFLSFFFLHAKTWPGRLIFLTLPLLLILADWRASFLRPFALPDPYKPLIRVQHEEEFALQTLNNAASPGTVILANNSNPYLPFLVDRRIVIVDNPDHVDGILVRELVSTIFVGSRPPFTDPTLYPFYGGIDEVSQKLRGLPGITLIERLPTGTEIYRIK